MSMSSSPHVVFMALAETGHINPMLPLVADLKSRGCHVSFFVDVSMRDVVEGAGATWYAFRTRDVANIGALDPLTTDEIARFVPTGTPEAEYEGIMPCGLCRILTTMEPLLEDLQTMSPRPDVIVYDNFLPAPLVAAHVLKIPAVSVVTYPGCGAEVSGSVAALSLESKQWVAQPRQEIIEKYGIDLLQHGFLLSFVSPYLNLVTTIHELYSPPEGVQIERFGHFPFRCVGSLINKNVPRVQNAHAGHVQPQEDLLHRVELAVAEGKRLVFVSMGTVGTSKHFWSTPFGHFADGNTGVCQGAERTLSDYTGKEFCEFVFRSCIDAALEIENTIIVVCVGPQPDVLADMDTKSEDVILCKTVPQLRLLELASVFVTHGGANSMHEALTLEVPLIVIPMFGDQPANADAVARHGAGVSFRHPLRTVHKESLKTSMVQMLAGGRKNKHRLAVAELAQKIKNAGGVVTASEAILAEVRSAKDDPSLLCSSQQCAGLLGGA